jgi:predicted transcriptional regulator
MNPQTAAKKLNARISEAAIARLVGCDQSTVHRIIANGLDPRWSLGDKLIRLCKKEIK